MDLFFKHCGMFSAFFLLSLTVSIANGLTVSVPVTKDAALESQLELICTHDMVDVVSLISVAWERTNSSGSFVTLVTYLTSTNATTIANGNQEVDKVRARLTGHKLSVTQFAMRLNGTECDDEKRYRCQVVYFSSSSSTLNTASGISNVSVTAPPKVPSKVGISPPALTVVEDTTLEFNCTVNVGRPAPTGNDAVQWLLYRHGESVADDLSGTTTISKTENCTFVAVGRLSYKMTAQDNKAVVRCAVKSDPSNLYSQSDQITVNYAVRPVTIQQEPNRVQFYEGERLTLDCLTTGFPAVTYKWYHNNSIELQTGPQLVLNSLTLTGSGTYTCEASNTFNSVTYNQTQTVTISVEPQTTTSSTTSTSPSTAPNSGTQPQTPADDDGLSTGALAGIIVGVIVVVVIIILIVVLCVCRKKPKQEIDEPSEKPRNNQDLSFINRPDILGNEDKLSNQLNNIKSNKNHENKYDSLKVDFNSGSGQQMHYADLTFDDKPRSRKPIQLYESDFDSPAPYNDVMMPSV